MTDSSKEISEFTASEFTEHLKALRSERERRKSLRKQAPNKRRSLTREQRERILMKTDGRCHICGGKLGERWQVDHVRANSSGGGHIEDNYLPAHSLCNNYRWDYLPEEIELILKIGVWARTEMERGTPVGQGCANGFLEKEAQNRRRRS